MKIFKIILEQLIPYKEPLIWMFEALQLWTLNLLFPIVFISVSPILLVNLEDFPKLIVEIFYVWFVGGFRYLLVFYIICLCIVYEEKFE